MFSNLKDNDIIYDFYSGYERVLFTVIKEFNVLKVAGYKISFLTYIFLKILIKIKTLEDEIFIKKERFFKRWWF
mgnify:CR=1 FL=1